jgi:hypothetical protein
MKLVLSILAAVTALYSQRGPRARRIRSRPRLLNGGGIPKRGSPLSAYVQHHNDADACYWAGLSYERLADSRDTFRIQDRRESARVPGQGGTTGAGPDEISRQKTVTTPSRASDRNLKWAWRPAADGSAQPPPSLTSVRREAGVFAGWPGNWPGGRSRVSWWLRISRRAASGSPPMGRGPAVSAMSLRQNLCVATTKRQPRHQADFYGLLLTLQIDPANCCRSVQTP